MTGDNNFRCRDKEGRRVVYGFNGGLEYERRAFGVCDGAEVIAGNAFAFCKALSFELPDSLREIEESAFYGCKNLKFVFIPKGVKRIGGNAFGACDALTVYCEGEPQEGWIAEPPKFVEENVTTDGDYAFDFHRGGVSYTRVDVDVSANWNKSGRPVITGVTRSKFKQTVKEYIENNSER